MRTGASASGRGHWRGRRRSRLKGSWTPTNAPQSRDQGPSAVDGTPLVFFQAREGARRRGKGGAGGAAEHVEYRAARESNAAHDDARDGRGAVCSPSVQAVPAVAHAATPRKWASLTSERAPLSALTRGQVPGRDRPAAGTLRTDPCTNERQGTQARRARQQAEPRGGDARSRSAGREPAGPRDRRHAVAPRDLSTLVNLACTRGNAIPRAADTRFR